MSKSQEIHTDLSVQIVNAFVKDGTGGNPAGVVLNADRFNEDEKLSIARKVGLSETAFVSKSETEGFKLDFFTPTKRIAHCGHATIATFSYLASLGQAKDGETSKETIDGPRKIILNQTMAYMEQTAPIYSPPSKWERKDVTLNDVLKSLSLAPQDLEQRIHPSLVNTGNNFIVIGVSTQDVLKNLQLDLDKISAISEKLDLIGYYIFTTETEADATTRMFAPRYGIVEEAATGMAAGPLACVLHDHLNIQKDTFQIEQGQFMPVPSPSQITVQLDIQDDTIVSLLAGGKGKIMNSIEISL